jgi:DNA-directed RNA polymerase specialized sigma24 family protein
MSYPAQYEALYDAAHQDVTQTVRYALSLSSAIHNLEVETQDVCQSCWLAAWRALEQGRDITPGWMHTVAQRAASNYRRGQQFEQGLFAFSIDEPVIDSAGEESSFLDSHIPDGALDKPDVRP